MMEVCVLPSEEVILGHFVELRALYAQQALTITNSLSFWGSLKRDFFSDFGRFFLIYYFFCWFKKGYSVFWFQRRVLDIFILYRTYQHFKDKHYHDTGLLLLLIWLDFGTFINLANIWNSRSYPSYLKYNKLLNLNH